MNRVCLEIILQGQRKNPPLLKMLKQYRNSQMKLRHIDAELSLQNAVPFYKFYHKTTRGELSSMLKITLLLFTKTT